MTSVSLRVFYRAHTAANATHQDPTAQLEQLRRNSLLSLGDLQLPEKSKIPNREMPGTAQAASEEAGGRLAAASGDNDSTSLFIQSYNEQATHIPDTTPAKPSATFADTTLVITDSGSKHEAPTDHPAVDAAPL